MTFLSMNISNNSNITKDDSNIDPFLQKIELATLSILFFLTIIGNTAVVFVLLCFKNQRNSGISCRTVSRMSFYIINLSIADITVAFLSVLTQIIWRYSIIFPIKSNFACKLVAFGQVFPVYGSTFILITMAYDRFTCICRPMTSCTWTWRHALIGIGVAWLLAGLISLPQMFLYSFGAAPRHNEVVETCWITWPSTEIEIGYLIMNCLGQFIVPLLLLIFFYVRIFLAVSKNVHFKKLSTKKFEHEASNDTNNEYIDSNSPRRVTSDNGLLELVDLKNGSNTDGANDGKILNDKSKKDSFFFRKTSKFRFSFKRSSSERTTNSTSSNALAVPMLNKSTSKQSMYKMIPIRQNWPANALSRSKIKTLKLTLMVVIAYILCTAPFYISVVWNTVRTKHANEDSTYIRYLFVITHLLFQLNSCVNPFIYMLFNGNFCKIIRRYAAKRSKRFANSNMLN